MDFWVLFYETGERRWDEYNSTYYYDSILKKALSFTLSRELDTGEDLSIIEIGDILWAFDEDDHEVFNVSFNVTSSSDIRDLEIHYVMTKDTGMYSSSFQEDGRIDERYVKSIRIASDYREEIDQLLFCLAASNMGGKRCTTEVFWVPLKDV
ncbi:MAG: hypothetical protein JW939_03895 [Candidatus Thermoplasmatota archaeon]|nr:hypothetical protein [Candidatus Thermoplasmatota archaeon]